MLGNWIAGGGRSYFDAVWAAVTQAQAQGAFRADPAYRTILEHVPEWEGRACLELVEDATIKSLLPSSVRADQIGGAIVHDYDGLQLSPTTLRYAKVLQDLVSFFPTFASFDSIVEVGIGYGGQARIISDYFAATTKNLSTYHLVDILPVTLLAQSYIDSFRMSFQCKYVTKSQISRSSSWDFVISNYAFSEFDRQLQEEYLENIVSRSKSGYLTMNTGLDNANPWNSDYFAIEQLLEMLPNAVVLPERPKTGPSNYILLFGEHNQSGVSPASLRQS